MCSVCPYVSVECVGPARVSILGESMYTAILRETTIRLCCLLRMQWEGLGEERSERASSSLLLGAESEERRCTVLGFIENELRA